MELCNDAEGLPVSDLICDRDDFAVLEMLEGRMIFPDVQSLEQFQQVQKDGGMEMI